MPTLCVTFVDNFYYFESNRDGENMLPENEPVGEAGDEEAPAEEAPAPRSREATAPTRGGSRQRNTTIGSLIRVMQDAMAAKQKQHEEKMRLLERLVSAVEAKK
ncbi:hypothetical protein HPB48_011644 [Haemaphysalis longicornis]|uniref:Uncharacterized protein n=1 Tax=Haemaphysalis longicornis TaxID=44386 RepID=A0A9J6G2S5_HAELO|nr:hypothetical protein HPB48_011644 [Haemaphysalis longicornis]